MKILTFFKKWRERALLKELQNLYFGNRAFGNGKSALDDWFERHYKDVLESDELLSFIERRHGLAARFMKYVPQTVKTQRVLCRLGCDARNKPCLKYSDLFDLYIMYYQKLSPEIERMLFDDEQKYRDALTLLRLRGYERM